MLKCSGLILEKLGPVFLRKARLISANLPHVTHVGGYDLASCTATPFLKRKWKLKMSSDSCPRSETVVLSSICHVFHVHVACFY